MATIALDASTRPFWFPEGPSSEDADRVMGLMSRVFDDQEPPFLQAWYGDRYRDFAMDPQWLAGSFVANADKEAEGARKLARIASEARNLPFAAEILEHAEDEARHARMYLAMLKLVFPEALTDEERQELLNGLPAAGFAVINHDIAVRPKEEILDDIVQMNIGEVRTRLHQMLLRPVAMAVCPSITRTSLNKLLERILYDEGRHILYTARILHDAMADGAELIEKLYRRRCNDFSELTLREVGVGQFD
jgi:hypothetical protein